MEVNGAILEAFLDSGCGLQSDSLNQSPAFCSLRSLARPGLSYIYG